MELALDGICRGDGKIYFTLAVKGVDPSALVDVQVYDKHHKACPFMVFPSGEPAHIKGPGTERLFDVVIADGDLSPKLLALAFRPDGTLIAMKTMALNLSQLHWQGRINTFRGNALIEDLRNSDRGRYLDRVSFAFQSYYSRPDEDGRLRGLVVIPDALYDEHLEVRIYDGAMKTIATATLFPKRPSDGFKPLDETYWEIPFSAAFPISTEKVIAMAFDGTGAPLPGFDAMENAYLRKLRDDHSYVYDLAKIDPDYDQWVHRYRTTTSQLAMQRRKHFAQEPCYTLVVAPSNDSEPGALERTLKSLIAQTYGHWKALVAVTKGTELPCNDERLQPVVLETGQTLTSFLNRTIAQAQGDYLAFVEIGDTVEPDALYEFTDMLDEEGPADLLYCDEDEITAEGVYRAPRFKPGFSLDYLRAMDYIHHLAAIRTNLLKALVPLDETFEATPYYAMMLAVADHSTIAHHVPMVHYHSRTPNCRCLDNDTADEKIRQAAKAALEAHYRRVGRKAKILEDRAPTTLAFRTDFPVEGEPLVSVVIPSKDGVDILSHCIDSVLGKTTYGNYEVVIVENNSTEAATFEYYEALQAQDKRVRVVRWPGTGFNFSEIVNFGVRESKGEYVVLLNNDTEVITPQWLELMLGMAQDPDVGAVGARLYYPDGTIQHSGVIFSNVFFQVQVGHACTSIDKDDRLYFDETRVQRGWSCVTAACLMVSRANYDAVGGLDPRFAVEFNDVDFCLKLGAAGKRNVLNPYVELIHFESISRGDPNAQLAKALRSVREFSLLRFQWPKYFARSDPFFNKNLGGWHYNLIWPAG